MITPKQLDELERQFNLGSVINWRLVVPELVAEIRRLEPLTQKWLDYQVWLKRDVGEVRQNDVTK